MAQIILNKAVVTKKGETGTLLAFDGKYITVAFPDRQGMFPGDALEKGFLTYTDASLQKALDEEKAKKAQEEKLLRLAAEKAAADRKTIQDQLSKTHFKIAVSSAAIRLAPAGASFTGVLARDKAQVREIFSQCDADITQLYSTVTPEMAYLRNYITARSRYAVGFLCSYDDTYVFRVFSRNDNYKRSSNNSITITHSDTTEVMRVLRTKNKVYYFFKNISFTESSLTNTNAHGQWHISDSVRPFRLNEIVLKCDCGYLSDAIPQRDVDCFQYLALLFPAFESNKAEIVFKHRLFSNACRIGNIKDFLQDYTNKQIDFACKNNALEALPVIKRFGQLDLKLLMAMQSLLKTDRNGISVYTMLEAHLDRLGLECPDLMKTLLNFVKKWDHFPVYSYADYIEDLAQEPGVTLEDFFDKHFQDKHEMMLLEKQVHYTDKEKQYYEILAQELSWIDREENDCFILIPKTVDDFQLEGRAQHNCVYTHFYSRKVISRRSIIVFLRKKINTPYVTVEFDYETFEVLQAFKKFNQPVDPALYEYITALGKQLRYEMYTQQ